ncbi:hypothetical protein FACS1894185_6680 [Betaproteobacteria bacterium]|nr:hypothetical protein FACS1894185_6680 [Betaproteobacteria bacterium]
MLLSPLDVIDMLKSSPLDEVLTACLKEWGYPFTEISLLTNETRLLHDLDMWGDDILEFFEMLQEEFGVDFSSFQMEKYFPLEFSKEGNVLVDRALCFAFFWKKAVERVLNKYPEVTLGMISDIIKEKKWIFD